MIGEGNFSFASSIATQLGSAKNIIATCFDDLDTLNDKYDDNIDYISNVVGLNGSIYMGVDATELSECKELYGKLFDRIVFNFPHTASGIKDTGMYCIYIYSV